MEEISPSVENALVHWFNTFPGLPRVVNSFDDLVDGLVFCIVLNQIDPGFSFISVQNKDSITNEESLSLYKSIQAYLKSDIVDEEAAASEDQVLNIDSILYDHNKDEILYLIKIILGLAMQCSQRNTFITRITELPKEIQDILMLITQEVLSTMQVPEVDSDEEIDDEHLKTFDEMMQEVGDGEEFDDWNEWNDTESPYNSTPLDHSEKLLEEKDNEIDSLKQEILRLTEENKDYQEEIKTLQADKENLLIQQEKLSTSLSESKQLVMKLQMENESQQKEYDSSVTQSTNTLKDELERLENENAMLIAENKTLTAKMTSLKNEYTNDLDTANKQLALLKEEMIHLQHVETTNQALSKQLAEYKKESQLASSSSSPVSDIPVNVDYQKQLAQLTEKVKTLQGENKETKHMHELAQSEIKDLRQTNEEYKNVIASLKQENEALQLLFSPTDDDNKKINEEKGVSFHELVSGKSEEESSWREKYSAEVEKLAKAKEMIMSLQKNINDLQIVNVSLQDELLKVKHGSIEEEGMNDDEKGNVDQVHILQSKLQITEEELEFLKKKLDVTQGELDYTKQQYASIQNDNQELTNNLKKEFDDMKRLEEKNKKLTNNFKQSLVKLKQCEVFMKECEKQIEEEKNRSIQQDKYVKQQEEVMFATIHKLGESSLMKYYKTHLDLYHPQGWLARVRMSQSKLF